MTCPRCRLDTVPIDHKTGMHCQCYIEWIRELIAELHAKKVKVAA